MIELDISFYSPVYAMFSFSAVSLIDGAKTVSEVLPVSVQARLNNAGSLVLRILRALHILRALQFFCALAGAQAVTSKDFDSSNCGSSLDFPGTSYATRIVAPAHFKGAVNTCYLLPRNR